MFVGDRMIYRTKVDGVIIEGRDGNRETDDIIDCSGSEELNREADARRLEFIKKHVASFGYKIVDKDGNVIP